MKHHYRLRPPVRDGDLPFGQEIEFSLDGRPAGVARWHAPPGDDGVIQIAEIAIAPEFQRQGHGSALLKHVYAQAAALYTAAGVKPRRVWMIVEQKKHVVARAFLSKHGFQHVSTMTALYRGQDGMLYQRSFD